MEDRQKETGGGEGHRGEGGLVTSVHLLSSRHLPDTTGGTQENREPTRLGGGEEDTNPIFPEERTFHTAEFRKC